MADENSGTRLGRLLHLVGPVGPYLRRWLTVWFVVVIVFAVISLVEVTRSPDAGVAIAFKVTSVTALLVALAWLPALVAILAVSGGAFKTPAGEANIPGLVDVVFKLIGTLDAVEPKLDDEETKRSVGDVVREASLYVRDTQRPETDLAAYARAYDALRSRLPPGDERTFRMSTIVAQVRALASQTRYDLDDLRNLFKKGREGDRVVALSVLQTSPFRECFDLALEAIANSKSAFEQYQGLRVVDAMLPSLNQPDIGRLRSVLDAQSKQYLIPENRDRWSLYQNLLQKIDKKGM